MSRIPHAHRIGGRYVWRRRVHFRNLISKPVAVRLRTADPRIARRRAARLSVRFDQVRELIERMIEMGRALTGTEIDALFRLELERELTQIVHDAYEDAPWSRDIAENAVPLAEAYRIARRPDRPRRLNDAQRADLTDRLHPADVHAVEDYLGNLCHGITDEEVRARLTAVGAPESQAAIAVARAHILRARAVAWTSGQRVFDDFVMDAADPVRALIDHAEAPSRGLSAASPPPQGNGFTTPECAFITYDERPFSLVIDDIVEQLRREGVWSRSNDQPRRILQTFAWITGDKRLGDYSHMDVDAFKQGLMRLPKDFKFGPVMTRPFSEVVAELPPLKRSNERHAKTVNRDLSTMSRVSRHLALTSWKPRFQGTLVLDFAAATITVKKKSGDDPRPPWTKEHLALLFSSPLFTGSGAALRRLHPVGDGRVYHDAAYWVPLLCYYHHSCREETCGLRVDEVRIHHGIPVFEIKANDVRGRDGELAGEKRAARRRTLPIHAELLRLGFLDYVEAIRAEGHVALFPELYIHKAKRGGQQFYGIAWTHMVDWVGERLELPRNASGKGPDMHSIRSLGSSFYEVDGVNDNMRADVMGHARTTVNGKHYSKRMATEGAEVVLRERRDFMARYIPVITGSLAPRSITLLPIEQRSRVGSGLVRKQRSDAGSGKSARH